MANRLSITVEAANERLKIGLSKRSDMLKAQTEYSNSIYLAIQLETSKNKALQNLLRISGLPLDTSILIFGSLNGDAQWFEGISTDTLFNLANQYLPEFQLINKQIEQQKLSVVIEQKKMYPEIGAFANYNYLKSPVYNGNFFGSAGLTLKMDIFTGWRKRNQVALEKIKTEQLNFQHEETSRQIYSEINMAILELSEAREKINNAKIQIESSNETLQTINQQYLDGISSMLELIDAQNSDFRANQNYINALADFDLAIALLKRKTGMLTNEYCK
jgi:outer membrane protein